MVKKPQRLKVNLPTQKKRTLDQIANFLAHLPDHPAVILTDEQYKALASQQRDNYWIGQCFVASFAGGDPLRPLLEAKQIDKWIYDYLWAGARFYHALWDLIQFSEEIIKAELEGCSGIKYPFASTTNLFLEIVKVGENNQFLIWLKKYHKCSVPDLRETATIVKNIGRKKDSPTSSELERLDRFLANYRFLEKNFWLKTSWRTCLRRVHYDRQIKVRVEAVIAAISEGAYLQEVACRKRESKTFKKYRSFEIHDGEVIYGNRHGGGYA